MKTEKAKSSKYVNDHHLTSKRLEGQEGHGAFSCGQSQIDAVYKYIENQEEHHQKHIFKAEYLGLLDLFKIPYYERYIFEDLK